MTLGDRVAVMRAGLLQQVGPPQELYENPVNLFVAGFIGSPSMNFVPGTIEGGTLKTPFGEIKLPDEKRKKLEENDSNAKDVIVGIRPEDFEDAELVGDQKEEGQTIKAKVEVLESLGSDKFAYFTVEGKQARAKELEEVARDAGTDSLTAEGDGIRVTARLDVTSKAAEDEELEVWFDARKLHVFDPESGKNLTL